MTSILDTYTKEIGDAVIDFVSEPRNFNRMLIIRTPQGSRKSTTTYLTLLKYNKKFVALGRNHKFLTNLFREDEMLKDEDIFIVKGRNQPIEDGSKELMCRHTLLKKMQLHRINITETLCKECMYKDGCPWREQFAYLKETNESWAGPIQYIDSNFLRYSKDLDVIVLDDIPLSGLENPVSFNSDNLWAISEILQKIVLKLSEEQFVANPKKEPRFLPFDNLNKSSILEIEAQITREELVIDFRILSNVIQALRMILYNLHQEMITGQQFVKMFFDNFKVPDETVIHRLDDDNVMEVLFSYYKEEVLREAHGNKENEYFLNIFAELFEILRVCFSKRERTNEFCFPVFAIKNKQAKDTIEYISVIKDLPNKPIIVLNANVDVELYRHLFHREVDVFKPSMPVERDIIQVTDGIYYLGSFTKYEQTKTRQKVFNATLSLTNKWIADGCEQVFIMTHKPLSLISEENNKTSGMSLEQFFKDNNVPPERYKIIWYELGVGMNYKIEQEDGIRKQIEKLIIIGEPEPNHNDLFKKASAWFYGEPPIILDEESKAPKRIVEPEYIERTEIEINDKNELSMKTIKDKNPMFGHDYLYEDKRYQKFVSMYREFLLEQNVERLRFINPSPNKKCVLISLLPIGFETKKMSMDEMLSSFGLLLAQLYQNITYQALKWIQEKQPTLSEFYDKYYYSKKMKELYNNVTAFREDLIKSGYCEYHSEKTSKKDKTTLRILEQGKSFVEFVDNAVKKHSK